MAADRPPAVAFALLSWLFAFALVLVLAAALGATLVEPVSGSPDPGDAVRGTPA